jgi:hypothetical protein
MLTWNFHKNGKKLQKKLKNNIMPVIPKPVWAVGFAPEQPLHVVALACSVSGISKQLEYTVQMPVMLKMKFALYVVFIVTIMLSVSGAFELCLCDEHTNWGKKEQKALFDRFNIPREFFCENIALELHRMSWYIDVAQKDNWQEATHHPALYKEDRSMSEYELWYLFETIEKRNKFEFKLATIEHSRFGISFGDYDYEDSMLNGRVRFHDNGNPKELNIIFSIYKFSEDNKSGVMFFPLPAEFYASEDVIKPLRYGRVEWNDGKTNFDDVIKNEQNFHRIYQQSLKEYPPYDLKPSVINKKPIKPITLDVEKDYAIQIPQHIHPDTRKVFWKVDTAYKTLKSGQVKKLLTDNYYKQPGEFSDGIVKFRFGKNYLYDVTASDSKADWVDGIYIMFDAKSHVKLWLSGKLREIDIASERKISDPLKVRYSIDGDGIEIHFHPTGFPKSYRTIIRNRLFGSQIEWDENGKIISNVDLEFPQKWKEAPEKIKK